MNGALLKKWMSEQGLRPEDLASKLGVSFSTARNLMAGKCNYRPTITALAHITGLPEEDLLSEPQSDQDEPPEPEAA